MRKREKPEQTVTPVFGGTESMKESEIRQMMYSAHNYYVENRLAINENAFLNSKKAIMLENQDVVTFVKSLIYDRKNNFECILLESKIDKNHYLAHNGIEESFNSTIFTVTRSTKDLSRAYLNRIQSFNSSKKTVQKLESELKMDYIQLKIFGACKAWMFSDSGSELVPARMSLIRTSPQDDLEYFRIYQLEVIG